MMDEIKGHEPGEEEPGDSHELFYSAFHSNPNLIAISNPDNGEHVDINDSWLNTLKFRRDEVIGNTVFKLNIWNDLRDRERILIEHSKRGRVRDFETQFRCKDGLLIDVAVSTAPIDLDNRKLVMWTANNITESNKWKDALTESEERLVLVLEGSQQGFWDWNIETGEVQRNDRWAKILGYSSIKEFEATVDTWTENIHPDDREAASTAINDHLEGRSAVYQQEYRMLTKSGKIVWIRDHAKIVRRDAKGRPLRMCGTHIEITELKDAQVHLIQASKLASLGEMATGMAHELNQPLNIIRMSAETVTEMLEAGEASPDLLKTRLERITSQIDRASTIIDHMRMFGRNATEATEPVSPKDVVTNAVSFLSEQIRLLDIELDQTLPETCRMVSGHAIQLEQVMLNLLSNARDAIEIRAKDGGERRITVRVEDDPATEVVCLVVEDTGGGIPENFLPRIFEPFYTTKEVGKGTGVGLSISYGIVTEMGGTITAENVDGGARFTVTLPVANETPDQA